MAGVALDKCGRNRSLENLLAIVQRLIIYKAKLVVFPIIARNLKVGDSSLDELATSLMENAFTERRILS